MTQISELRIGNTVLVDGKEAKISSLGYDHIGINGGCQIWRIEEIEGIPLTPEWLERAGFEIGVMSHDGDCWRYHKKIGKLELVILKSTGYNVHAYLDPDRNQVISEPNYLHQLQNLCFCLGEELTFKEI